PLHLLDGGRAAWEAEGRPLAGIAPERAAAQRTPGAAAGATRIGRDGVLAGLGAEGRVLLDLRSVEEYRGESLGPPPDFNHGAERFGRIPGARHLPYTDLIDATGRFRAPEEMRAAFAARGVVEGAEVVMYCRLSHRASLGWTALTEVLGVPGARVYDGSWTEWGSLVGVPVER
ncbi:MAG: rhodanese-like domain-containing protein, partial [Pseudomonadota bacterium]